MRTLLHHWTRSTLTPTLLEVLGDINLSELLDDIHGVDLTNLMEWNSFYLWMKKQVCVIPECTTLLPGF